jgi:MOSC domain-containing protein YiiM
MSIVVSVNVGRPRTVEWFGRQVTTAIWKEPVADRVRVAGINLDGDDQADRRVHGGSDKAVYAYAIEDYRWWAQELDQPIPPGTFGENLTTEGLDLTATLVGERWQIGATLLEASAPRLPCVKLGIRMGDAGFVDHFSRAGRHGTYLRIVDEGDVGSGDPIAVVSRPDHGLRVVDIALAYETGEEDLIQRLTEIPDVPGDWVEWAHRQLERRSA